jgi:exopolysaccharide biosynthesis polyprenyl glycosylphosphotransferase
MLLASFVGAYAIRDSTIFTARYAELRPLNTYLWMFGVIIPTWFVLLTRFELHRPATFRSISRILMGLAQVQVLGGLMLLASVFLVDHLEVSRLFTQMFLVISGVSLVVEKIVLRLVLIRVTNKTGRTDRWKVVVVSDSPGADRYLALLRDHPNWAVDLIGTFPLPKMSQTVRNGRDRSGVIAAFSWPNEWTEQVIDEVIAIAPLSDAASAEPLSRACLERGITFRFLVNLPRLAAGKYYVEALGPEACLLSVETVPQGTINLVAKRAIDIVGAIVGLLVCGLAYLWYAPRIASESPGPVIFSQQRVGCNGRRFTMYKFRTMCIDAERRLNEVRRLNQMNGHMFKLKEDPRVTPTGRLMRRYHLDELPQFWNILKGEMSLVGTRPPTWDEVTKYSHHHYRRLSMKPGLTGLWQLNGNGKVNEFEEVVRLDCEYIDRWSLWLDCRIIAKTLGRVFHADGW